MTPAISMFADIERAIAGLHLSLREALLLPAMHSYAKSAAALGIDTAALGAREREAQEQLAQQLLGDGWRDDSAALRVLMVQIDQVAIGMQRRRSASQLRGRRVACERR